MKAQLPNLEAARVLVVGDLILDRYWHGDAGRISPEAPVPVVRVSTTEDRIGGAGNVAANVVSLGGRAAVAGRVGADAVAIRLEELLDEAGVGHRLRRDRGQTTPTKLRVLSKHQQLIRLDFEEELAPAGGAESVEVVNPDTKDLGQLLDLADVLILSDYGKGGLVAPTEVITEARRREMPVLVDPWGDDFSPYRGATIITPNQFELERVVGPWSSEAELHGKASKLIGALDLEALLVTQGQSGMTLIWSSGESLQLPTRAREVFDVTGAGDTVVAVAGAAMAVGCELAEAVAVANVAAGLVVGKLGTATVAPHELRRGLRGGRGSGGTVLTRNELPAVLAAARGRGESIVMTNGCFDVLHAGHVAYLEEARQEGDRLLVAVNDDASVERLKGADRPIHTLDHRLRVLAALASVDWVVPFSEDTPEALLREVVPDVLVKGGDLREDQVVGRDWVLARGGRVAVVGFVEGCSTSSILDRVASTDLPSGLSSDGES